MDVNWKELCQELGKVVEETGRMLQRDPEFSKQDLTNLRDTLNHAASTVQTIRDNTFV